MWLLFDLQAAAVLQQFINQDAYPLLGPKFFPVSGGKKKCQLNGGLVSLCESVRLAPLHLAPVLERLLETWLRVEQHLLMIRARQSDSE